LDFSALEVGAQFPGTVTGVQSCGIFVLLHNSTMTGLIPRKLVSNPSEYSAGDQVKVAVNKIDSQNSKFWLTLDLDLDLDLDQHDQIDEDSEDHEEDDLNLVQPGADGDQDPDFEENSEDEPEPADDEDENSQEMETDLVPTLPVAGLGFEWSDFGAKPAHVLSHPPDEDQEKIPILNQRKKKTRPEQKEKEFSEKEFSEKEEKEGRHQMEKEQQIGLGAPESVAEFERRVLASPNASYLWIQYMAFHVALSEIDKARKVAEEALQKINYREEEEKFNVWVAYLNLESLYGTAESLRTLFEKGQLHNNTKKIYFQMAVIFTKQNKIKELENLFQAMTRKFKESSRVWIKYGLYLIKNQRIDEYRKLLQRSLLVLPKRKHLKVISKFAQIEFKHGSAERGRTIFEGIMANYPKRVDLWNVYLDMEIRLRNPTFITRLFERITSLKLSSKKMKFFFKKWLNYAKGSGAPQDVDVVKEKAVAYIHAVTK